MYVYKVFVHYRYVLVYYLLLLSCLFLGEISNNFFAIRGSIYQPQNL
jgi:hypothetical protein